WDCIAGRVWAAVSSPTNGSVSEITSLVFAFVEADFRNIRGMHSGSLRLVRGPATSMTSKDRHDRDDQKPGAKQEQTESSATNLSDCDADFASNRKREV